MGTIQPRYSKDRRSPNGDIVKWITVKTNFIGFHHYENAPREVAFLRNSHRHRFYVEALIQVFHGDRELEFFMVQELLDRDIIPLVCIGTLGSCEQISEDILWGLVNTYGDYRNYYVEVSEDNENSGTTSWLPYNQPCWATGNRQVDASKEYSSQN